MPASDSPGPVPHTLAEILSQPSIWLACRRETGADSAFRSAVEHTASRKEWLFVGCGSSFYLAEAAAACWTSVTDQRARALPASELLLFPSLCQLNVPNLQVVVISRSGRTSEAVRAADLLRKQWQVPTLGITCAVGSELAKACDDTIVLAAADEKSMVMTRSFTSMLHLLIQLAESHCGSSAITSSQDAVAAALSARIQPLRQGLERFVAEHNFADYVYLAQGPFFPVAREAALKITEMSGSYAQVFHTLEFRHGPKTIVSPETCLVFLLSQAGIEAESEVLVEMKELGGTIIAACNRAPESVRPAADFLFEMEADVPELALLAPSLVPAQMLGFYTGVNKGLNPDEPKNLSRVVVLD